MISISCGSKPAELAVLDQVVRVPMVPLVADVDAGVVQQRAVFQPLALAIARACGPPGSGRRATARAATTCRACAGRVAAPLAQLDDAAAADVGVALDLADRRRVAVDVVEDEPLAEREVAQRDVVRAEPPQDAVEQHRSGDGDVGAPRIEPVHVQACFEIRAGQPLPQPVDRLRGDAAVAQRLVAHDAVLAERQRAEAEDRPRRADDAVEPLVGDACRGSRRSPC